MWYYKARIYSPTLGRFMQPDPIGYGDGMNLYAYVRGDPVNATDPSGTRQFCWTERPATTWDGKELTVTATIERCVYLPDQPGGIGSFDSANGGGGGGSPWEEVFDGIIGEGYRLFCALPPIEISTGADAYLGIGASGGFGVSFDIRTLQLRGSVGGTLGGGFGGGLGVGVGAGSTRSGFSQEGSATLGIEIGSLTVSSGGLSGGISPRFGPILGVWGGISGKYTTTATPNITGACND